MGHTQEVAGGSDLGLDLCYTVKFPKQEKGWCVQANGQNLENRDEKLLQEGNYGDTQQSIEECLNMCRSHKDATACQMNWDIGTRGCYMYTQEALVAEGNGAENHFCYIA